MAARLPRTARVCCPSHPDADLVEDYRAGDLVCPECGLVVGDRVIDVGTEWRTFSNESGGDDPSRVGGPENPLLDGDQLTTIIGGATGSAGLDANGFSKYRNRKTMSAQDRALTTAFKEISTMAERINLPRTIVDQANVLFKQVYESKVLRGRSADAIASSCVYIACRKEGVPRTFKEICAISRVSKKEIGRCFKLILSTVGASVELVTTGDLMPRFCANLALPSPVQRAATHIARKARDLDLVPGRSPVSVAAAAIFLACAASKSTKSSKEIGEITGVAESTIRQTYKHLLSR
ncbi:transcription initiation factor IIB-like [Paramacrobiotus metropolitanus]|uniref:transcription initiation factor IIB-like n=1 Tax=Paramacrobiotus metropolitanus TaxID=2943436 RepID=UPI0024458148|nr:transcription initiation factor IIB-like [Paramacrobiotus metropolitanus]